MAGENNSNGGGVSKQETSAKKPEVDPVDRNRTQRLSRVREHKLRIASSCSGNPGCGIEQAGRPSADFMLGRSRAMGASGLLAGSARQQCEPSVGVKRTHPWL